MPKQIPTIKKYMTTAPVSVAADSSLSEALDMMKTKNIRHLPVMRGNQVFGLLSDRDMKNILAYIGTKPETMIVGDVCNDEVYQTQPEALLSDVAAEMASRKVGSALILDNGKLVGIFTATDVCHALADICESRFHH